MNSQFILSLSEKIRQFSAFEFVNHNMQICNVWTGRPSGVAGGGAGGRPPPPPPQSLRSLCRKFLVPELSICTTESIARIDFFRLMIAFKMQNFPKTNQISEKFVQSSENFLKVSQNFVQSLLNFQRVL